LTGVANNYENQVSLLIFRKMSISKKAVLENSNADIQIIEDVTHNGIRHSLQAYELIKNWFSTL
jgi:hypothetical protein